MLGNAEMDVLQDHAEQLSFSVAMSNEEQIDLGKALEEDKVEWNEAIDGIHGVR